MLVTMRKPEIHPNKDTEPIPAVSKKLHCDIRFKIVSECSSDFNEVLLGRICWKQNND
jgi:hypothetical protein